MALGDFAQQALSLGRTQTSGTTYVNKVTMNTPALPAATYMVTASMFWQSETSNNFQWEFVEDTATQIFQSGLMRSWDGGVGSGDPVHSYVLQGPRTLGAGTHQYDLNFRRQNGAGNVTILGARLGIFQLDATHQFGLGLAYSSTTSTSYVNKVTFNTGAIAAGTYRVGFSMEYNCDDPTSANNMGLRFRERRDPAGANVITNLLGDDAGQPAELEVNNGGYGIGSTTSRQQCAWSRPCRVLVADTYQYELAYRAVGGAFDDVGVALGYIDFFRMS